ncbi:MAG TPA: hypothetical protein VK864_18850 [Longimicrobiales bacterium]|nr:hypothetical protein [Longimicrobiales bacterium]
MDLSVEAGAITALRLFDVAYAIDLGRVEQLAAAPARIRLQRAAPKAIAFGVSPVEFSLGRVTLPLDGRPRDADVSARVYDFGAVVLLLRLPIENEPWAEFVGLSNQLAEASESETGGDIWRDLLSRVLHVITPAMDRPTNSGLQEGYLIAATHRFDRSLSATELLETVDLVPLLAGEARPLAAQARADLLRHSLSYYDDDLVVLTWDRAFALEPSGSSDIADVLEVANAQLLELRYYDELLDTELPRMYDRVAGVQQALRGLGRRRYAMLARELHALVADVTEITERVDNALKVTEDVYLARVYGAALDLFRVRTWSSAVDRKLAIVRDTYAALYDEAATARAELLEMAIVLLIVLEIVLAFVL